MKLIERTNFYYLIYTFFIFALGTVLFYFLIRKVLVDGIDEALQQEKKQLIENLKYEQSVENLKPSENIQIVVKRAGKILPDKYNTITIFDREGQTHDFRQLTSVYRHNAEYYEIHLRQSMDEAEALIESILPIEVVLFLLLLAGVLILSRQVSGKVWRPFYALLDQLQNYNLGQVGIIKAEVTKVDEFDALNESIEKMTKKIHNDYISQKEFNENSSHELQTPIAIIKNKLELLIQSENLGEKDMHLVESMFDALRRLSVLNRGLILLSKIDNAQYSDFAEVNLGEMIEKVLDNFSEAIAEKEIVLHVDLTEECILSTNIILTEILLNNIFSNAIKHNLKNGFINIHLVENALTVSNAGLSMDVDPNTLFERFKKNSDLENSVGLGLSIVKKICEFLHINIDYAHKNHLHIIKILF